MAALHIRDISDKLMKRLKTEAAMNGVTLREWVVKQLEGAAPRRADVVQAEAKSSGHVPPGSVSKPEVKRATVDPAEMPAAPTLSVKCSHEYGPKMCPFPGCENYKWRKK